MPEFGAFEAKNRFGHLLDLVERGEEVTITRHGREVEQMSEPVLRFERTEFGHDRLQKLA
jgi:antitoxin (DNA-binding transcriptional repressor) of toxin-antitoxin stability system